MTVIVIPNCDVLMADNGVLRESIGSQDACGLR